MRLVYRDMEFTVDDIVGGSYYQAFSPICDALEIGTIEVDVRTESTDQGYKLRNFARGDKLTAYEGNRQRGIWYVDKVERTGKYTYTIKASDAVSLLDKTQHFGGIYTGQTVAEVVADICTIPYFIRDTVGRTRLYGWLPVASRRENLAQVLFATGLYSWVDYEGTLLIGSLWDGVSSNIPGNRIFTDDKVSYGSKVTSVSVIEHTYSPGAEDFMAFEGTVSDGDIIVFTEPLHSVTSDGIRIKEHGANYVVVGSGSGKINGKKYLHTKREVSRKVYDSDVEVVQKVENASLVSVVNSVAVAERLALYYRAIETVSSRVVYEGENSGDVIAIDHPYDGTVTGCIRSISVELGTSKFTADTEIIVGFSPQNVGEQEYFDEKVILTSNGTWTVPEGVNTITVVCIGGGQGGWSGLKGDSPNRDIAFNVSRGSHIGTSTRYYSDGFISSVGGSGGLGGQPGKGGKITTTTIDVTPGDIIPITIGKGGAGGIFSSAGSIQGALGTDSIFGSITSATGASSDSGYIDVTTGVSYGVKGEIGIAGGNGSGGNPNAEITADFDNFSQFFVHGAVVKDRSGRQYTPIYKFPSYPSASTGDWNYGGDSAGYRGWQTTFGLSGGAAVGGTPSIGGKGSGSASASTSRITCGYGGRGADATAPELPHGYGTGGYGGNGGGGGGGCGMAYVSYDSEHTTSVNKSGGLNSSGGGNGSNGGNGADGCIIIFYRKLKPVLSGALVGKKNRFIVDATGRLVVV